jgi:hypothetical protein
MSELSRFIAEAAAEYLVEPLHRQSLDEILALESAERANDRLHRLTGIRNFFPHSQAFDTFRHILLRPPLGAESSTQREWGDFQTPLPLATQVCEHLVAAGVAPQIVIEPTHGAGHFILAALEAFPDARLVYGVEIQARYEWHLKIALLKRALSGHGPSAELELHRDDIFTHSFSREVHEADNVLIIGNPPWVTAAELGVLAAGNLPRKRNLKGLNGLDAVTGKSNFDLGEFIVLRMLELFSRQRGTLAMLCKNSVIKNVVQALPRLGLSIGNLHAYGIDAQREFGAAVDASLLILDMGVQSSSYVCEVATLDRPRQVTRAFGWAGNRFVADVHGYAQVAALDGSSPFVWRQGIKHDCATIMELDERDGIWVNGKGDAVEVEEARAYRLLKGSDLRKFEAGPARKRIVVTQRHIGEDTAHLRIDSPRLWHYLTSNAGYFDKRKSSIYRGRPRFSIFGVGEYSFKPYKVAISGLHKRPLFCLVSPVEGRPVMLDDTCYFLGFDAYLDALLTAVVLNSAPVRQFLESIVFADAKRPYTKEVLMRIDLVEAAQQTSFDAIRAVWSDVGYEPALPVTQEDFEAYRSRLLDARESQQHAQLKFPL